MENDLFEIVMDASVEVHRSLGGPGLLENVYEAALCHELSLKGISTQTQLPVQVLYKGVVVREPLYLDIVIGNEMVIEVKATERDFAFYQAQLFTYLRLTGIKLGLLVNFGKKDVRQGICRVINDRTAQNVTQKPIFESRSI
jgi:GxxExxY protein